LRHDLQRVQALGDAISKNGFMEDGTCSGFWCSDNPEEKICKADSDFRHPGDVVDCLRERERRLSWWPILNQSQIRCAILTYEREES